MILATMMLAAITNSVKDFLGLVYLIVMIVMVIFGFLSSNPKYAPYAPYAVWPVVVCLAIVGWVLFGPGH